MPDLKKSKNYAVAKGPVNRRTAVLAPAEKPMVARSVLQRVHMAQAKRRLGAPLSQRLAVSAHPPLGAARLSKLAILQVVGATVCVTGLGLGIIQSSVAVMGGSAVGLASIAAWAAMKRQAQRTDGSQHPTASPELSDPNALAQLDAVMESMAAQAPEGIVKAMTQLKESIVRCSAMVRANAGEGSLASEESLYLREAVRRYIPDSINSCLKVPEKDRASMVIDGSKPALDLLQDQLQMIQIQLDAREATLTQAAGEALLRQQRFLAAKSSGPT